MHIVIDARNRRSSTGRYTDNLLYYLQKIDKEHKYTVLLEPDDPWRGSSDNFCSLPCRYKQFSFNPVEQIGFAIQLYRLHPSLVHFTMTQQPLLYFGKIVTTTHDLTMLRFTRASRFPNWLHHFGMLLYRFLFWMVHKKSIKIIVPTNYVAKDLVAYQPFTKNKIVRIYESSEPPINSQAKKPSGISKPFIFHVGQPLPHKNIERLITAFSLLKASWPELSLILPGKISGVFRTEIENCIEQSGVKSSILLPGFVTDEELKWLYENAECYVLPSLSEGFGLPGLEAMAHGCPLVSSSATCLPEVFGNGAHYFDPENVDDMVAKIGEVLDNKKLRAQLIKNGHQQLKKYSWEKMARETLTIYQQILKQTE